MLWHVVWGDLLPRPQFPHLYYVHERFLLYLLRVRIISQAHNLTWGQANSRGSHESCLSPFPAGAANLPGACRRGALRGCSADAGVEGRQGDRGGIWGGR